MLINAFIVIVIITVTTFSIYCCSVNQLHVVSQCGVSPCLFIKQSLCYVSAINHR